MESHLLNANKVLNTIVAQFLSFELIAPDGLKRYHKTSISFRDNILCNKLRSLYRRRLKSGLRKSVELFRTPLDLRE